MSDRLMRLTEQGMGSARSLMVAYSRPLAYNNRQIALLADPHSPDIFIYDVMFQRLLFVCWQYLRKYGKKIVKWENC
jgi:hypothetical protein